MKYEAVRRKGRTALFLHRIILFYGDEENKNEQNKGLSICTSDASDTDHLSSDRLDGGHISVFGATRR